MTVVGAGQIPSIQAPSTGGDCAWQVTVSGYMIDVPQSGLIPIELEDTPHRLVLLSGFLQKLLRCLRRVVVSP
jgi:hypothetical protein